MKCLCGRNPHRFSIRGFRRQAPVGRRLEHDINPPCARVSAARSKIGAASLARGPQRIELCRHLDRNASLRLRNAPAYKAVPILCEGIFRRSRWRWRHRRVPEQLFTCRNHPTVRRNAFYSSDSLRFAHDVRQTAPRHLAYRAVLVLAICRI